jgi:hypothetical protein
MTASVLARHLKLASLAKESGKDQKSKAPLRLTKLTKT